MQPVSMPTVVARSKECFKPNRNTTMRSSSNAVSTSANRSLPMKAVVLSARA